MRKVAKAAPKKQSHFLTTCGTLWRAATETKSSSAVDERLEIRAHKLGVRKHVTHQIVAMAKLFGISPHYIQNPENRALRLMRNCDGCKMGGHCFVTKRGRPDQEAHISPQSCPNFSEYQDIARDIGSRKAIRNKLV